MSELWLPNRIRTRIAGKAYQENHVGMSDSSVFIFDDVVLKIQKHSSETDNEYKICLWLEQKIPTPQILAYEIHDEKSYCLMSRITGRMACEDVYLKNPQRLLEVVVNALHMLWSVDITDCPCDNSLDVKLEAARYNIENHLVDLEHVEPETFGEDGFRSPEELLVWLETNRPSEELVFSHGDFSLPNILAEDDQIRGFIDLGKMGIADKWQDLAICYRSLKHNFEGKYNGGVPYAGYSPTMLFEKLGIPIDWKKLRYYLLLDELF